MVRAAILGPEISSVNHPRTVQLAMSMVALLLILIGHIGL